jgi:GNAT superfamily N-acetyltransferase
MNIKIIAATLNMLEKIAAVQTAAFSKREPMTMSLEFTEEELHNYFMKIIPVSINSGLTIAAVDEDTEAVAGVAICFDAFEEFPNIEWTSKEIDGISKTNLFFSGLEKPLENNPAFKPKKCVRYIYVSTDENYLRRGIARKISEAVIKRAIDLNYKLMIADATNIKSAAMLEKLGFQKEKVLQYTALEQDGVKPFGNVAGACILYSKYLQEVNGL